MSKLPNIDFKLISASDAMPAPLVTFQNSSEVKIQWDKQSFHHGGPIKRYEVRVLAEKTNEEFIINDVNGNASHSLLRLDHLKKNVAPDCDNTNVTYYYDFSIRSVTSNGSDEFYSSWSPVEAVQEYCPGNESYFSPKMVKNPNKTIFGVFGQKLVF